MKCPLLHLVLLTALFTLSGSWRVLVANPFAGGSHQSVSLYLANLLATNGHHVTYLSTNIPKKLNSEVIKLELPETAKVANTAMDTAAYKQVWGIEVSWSEKYEVFQTLSSFCHLFYEEPNVQMMIKSGQQFDLLIAFGAQDGCALALGQHLKINNSVLHMPGAFLLPTQITHLGIPLYASSHKVDGIRLADPTSLRESMLSRAAQLVKVFVADALNCLFFRYAIDTVAYKHLPHYTGYKDLYSTVRVVFMHYNPHPLVDLPLPMGPGVINLGGSTCDMGYDENKLPSDLRDFVDSSQGFILISFGSHLDRLPEEEVKLWVKVFSTLPYSVVWRLVGHTTTLPDNIRTYKWLPQQTLLQHPNINMFISHGGYGSKIEAVCAGVPLLFVPRFAEQPFTAQHYSDIGTAEQILMNPAETTVEEITTKISKTLEVHSKTMKEVSRQVLQTRVTDDQALGYLEMAASGHQLLPGYQPWYQYFYIDLIIIPTVIVAGVRYLIRKYMSRV